MFFKDDALLKTLDVFVILEGLPSLQCLLVISFCILSVFCLSTVTTYVILWYLPQKNYARVQKTFKKFDFLPWLVSQYLEMSSPSTFVKSNFFPWFWFYFSISTIALSLFSTTLTNMSHLRTRLVCDETSLPQAVARLVDILDISLLPVRPIYVDKPDFWHILQNLFCFRNFFSASIFNNLSCVSLSSSSDSALLEDGFSKSRTLNNLGNHLYLSSNAGVQNVLNTEGHHNHILTMER